MPKRKVNITTNETVANNTNLTVTLYNRTFSLDVSDQNPAFEASGILISELEKHLALRKIVKRPKLYLGFPLEWWLILALLTGLVIWRTTSP